MSHIHLHSQSKRRTYYVIFLLVPSLIFIAFLVVYVFFSNSKEESRATATVSNVRDRTVNIQIGDFLIEAELADTETTRARGLSGREFLGDMEGMLFDFGREDVQPSFWMKDMIIPIDIIWIDNNMIVQIDENVQPPIANTADSQLEIIRPNQNIDLVLEVRAGLAMEQGIQLGDMVVIN